VTGHGPTPGIGRAPGFADTVIVLDFETTGLSPDQGDRVIEVGAVRVEAGRVTDRFQSLMNPGVRVSAFIEDYTGITNAMLRAAPPSKTVIGRLADFIGDQDLVAHNASFDRRFLDAECRRIRRSYGGAFACSMLAARRIYPNAPNHKLGTLVALKQIPNNGDFHRALADAEMTANLWVGMLRDLSERHGLQRISFALMQELGRVPRSAVAQWVKRRARTATA